MEKGGAGFNGRWMQAVGGWKGAVLDGEKAVLRTEMEVLVFVGVLFFYQRRRQCIFGGRRDVSEGLKRWWFGYGGAVCCR